MLDDVFDRFQDAENAAVVISNIFQILHEAPAGAIGTDHGQ